jgi:hypothetical protein
MAWDPLCAYVRTWCFNSRNKQCYNAESCYIVQFWLCYNLYACAQLRLVIVFPIMQIFVYSTGSGQGHAVA